MRPADKYNCQDTLTEVVLGPVDVPMPAQLPMSLELREIRVAEFAQLKADF